MGEGGIKWEGVGGVKWEEWEEVRELSSGLLGWGCQNPWRDAIFPGEVHPGQPAHPILAGRGREGRGGEGIGRGEGKGRSSCDVIIHCSL